MNATKKPRCPLCKRVLYNGKDRLIYGDRHERCEALKREARDEERRAKRWQA